MRLHPRAPPRSGARAGPSASRGNGLAPLAVAAPLRRALCGGGGGLGGGAAARSAVPALRAVPSSSGPTTDAAVPEGHKGLHSALYDRDAADVHAPEAGRAFRPVEGQDDGSALVEVEPYIEARDGAKPPGVFALYDSTRALQYVGYSRNIVLSIKTLRARVGPERAAYVRALVVANQAMQTRSALQKQAQAWLDEVGAPPPGNADEAALWGAGGSGEVSADVSVMSADELAAYEDKKLKLIKAMGIAPKDDAAAEAAPASMEERRARMIAAVEGGDWSAVIDEQTQATLPARPAAVVAAARVDGPADGSSGGSGNSSAAGPPASPFTQAGVHRKIGESAPQRALTRESVIAALEEVRPYLQADGGDVEVVGVEDGVVALRLEGACSTCASSSATLKMGIERALSAAFGDALKGVVQVDKRDNSATVAGVDEHLNVVRPAIKAMGGAVEVASVEGGVVVLRYKGPAPLAKGLVAAVRDRYPEVKDVQIAPFQ